MSFLSKIFIPETGEQKLRKYQKFSHLVEKKYDAYLLFSLTIVIGDNDSGEQKGKIQVAQNFLSKRDAKFRRKMVQAIPLHKRQEWFEKIKNILEL